MTQFAEYVQSKNLTVEQLFYCSARLERHRVEDRILRVRREELRRSGNSNGYADVAKPRSGRGLSRTRIAAALAGEPLTARVRAKLARAVAALVARNGEAAPGVRELFGDVQSRPGGVTVPPAASPTDAPSA